MGEREVILTREIYIEQEDFMEDPPRKYFRLAPGKEVRLRYACYITATEVIKDDSGNVVEVRAEMDPESRGASTPDGRRVKGTIHWVSATKNVPFEARLYDNLFLKEDPNEIGPSSGSGQEGGSFLDNLNPDSLETVQAYGEPALESADAGDRLQFERKGYYCVDPDSRKGAMVVNRSVGLRDSWGKKHGK